MTITTFIGHNGGQQAYTFPQNNQDFRTNFGEVVARATRLPGASGGIDESGSGRAPNAIGNIQFSFYLVVTTRSEMQAQRDEVKKMIEWGRGKLYDQLNGVERWANCRVNNINIPEERHKNTDLFQKVQISFQATDPFWYSAGTTYLWGGGQVWGGGATWGGGGDTNTFTPAGETATITNNGSAYTVPDVRIENTTGSPISSVLIERLEGSTVTDQLQYLNEVAAGDIIDILSRSHTVQSAIIGDLGGNVVSFNHPDWFRLLPGDNTIRVTPASGSVDVSLNFFERYT